VEGEGVQDRKFDEEVVHNLDQSPGCVFVPASIDKLEAQFQQVIMLLQQMISKRHEDNEVIPFWSNNEVL